MVVVRRGHRFVGTYVLDSGQLVVGAPAVQRRVRETGGYRRISPRVELWPDAIEAVIYEAETTFEPILRYLNAKHPLMHLIARLRNHVADLRAGSREIDLYTVFKLQRVTASFRRWAGDPSTARLLQEARSPKTFHHNAILLEVASTFESAGLGPEFVPQAEGRTPDLVLRLSAAATIQIDTKTPESLQRPLELDGLSIDPSGARKTIRHALRMSRGQFSTDGILVIGGDFWINGLDAYAEATEKLLSEELPSDASEEARDHYARLLGVILASAGYEELEPRSFRPRLFLRWVTNPRYAGSLDLSLPADVEGQWRIRAPAPGGDKHRIAVSEDAEAANGEAWNPVGFLRLDDGSVIVEGRIANTDPPEQPTEPLTAFEFPVGYRPDVAVAFDVACETGFTVVEVLTDGRLLTDPLVGWIDLHGVQFQTREA
jgi:hypothetical protein